MGRFSERVEARFGRCMVRKVRMARELQACVVAERCRISPQYLALVESGARVPRLHVAIALARVLGSSVEALWPLEVVAGWQGDGEH